MQVMPRGTKKITVAVRGPITSKRWCIAPGSGSSTRAAGFQSVTPSTSDPKAPWHADESSDEVPAGALPTDSEPVTSDALTPSSSSEDLIPGLTTPSTLTSPDASQLEDSFDLMDIVGDTFDTRDVINLIKTASQPAPPSPHDSVPQRPPRIGLLGSTGLYTTHGLGADVPTAVAEPPRGPTCKPSTRRTTFNAAKTCGVKATPRSLSEFNSNDKTVRAAAPSPLQQTKRTLGSIGNSGLYSTKGPEAEIARRDVDWVVGLMNLAAHLVQGRAEQEAKKQVSLPECPIQSCCACPFFEMVTKGMLSKAMSGLSLWGVLHKLQVVCNCSVLLSFRANVR